MTKEEEKLGKSCEERRQALQDETRFKWDDEKRCYVSLEDEKVRFDDDGEQIIEAPGMDNFDDIVAESLRRRYGYYEAQKMMEERRKGGKI